MRLSTTFVAACATGLALITPVAANAAPAAPAPELSAECQAQVDKAKQAHKDAFENGTAGSSFMGPQELLKGIFNGYGSSGMPKTPDCVAAEQNAADKAKEEEKWSKMPEWAQSARPSEETKEVFSWISVALTGVAAVVQALAMVAKSNPALLEPVKEMLRNAGVNV